MEFLVPLLIFGAGLVFSGIKSAQETKKQQQRKIDLDKIERPKPKNAPLQKQKPITNDKRVESGKSVWQTLVDDFKEEYQKLEQGENEKNKTKEQNQPRQSYSPKEQSKRLEQDLKKRYDRSKEAARETRKRTEDRVQNRPQVAKSEVQVAEAVESTIKVAEPVLGVTKNTKNHQPKPTFDIGDITFDEKAFVNGVIMNEILGPPKSRRKRR